MSDRPPIEALGHWAASQSAARYSEMVLSQVVSKAPRHSPKKEESKRKYEGPLKEDLRGKWVKEDLVEIVVSNLRFSDKLAPW